MIQFIGLESGNSAE